MRWEWILVLPILWFWQAGLRGEEPAAVGVGSPPGNRPQGSGKAALAPKARQTEAVLHGSRIVNFTLRDYHGKRVSLVDSKDNRFTVVMFLGVECPLARLYGPRMQKLAAEYRGRGVAFLGIDSNRQDSVPELAAFAQLHHIDFPLLKDPGNRVADMFAATRMSEVLVLDRELVVRYRGRIDDQYGPGYASPKPQRNDLQEALDELLNGKAVSAPTTEVAGCLIGRVRAPDQKSSVTYASHIAGILNKRCVECHRAGEIGPFALTEYDEVAGWAEMIAEVVEDDRMPPWHANPQFGEFEGDRRLSAEEKELLCGWAAAGAPEGDRSTTPEPPKFLPSGWQFAREPDLVVAMRDTPFTVTAKGVLDYQFFIVDPGFKEDQWVSVAQVMPGNRAVVHHVTVFAFAGSPEQALKDGTTDGYLGTYVPGFRPAPYPEGMAKRIVAGSQIVFQIHYTPNGSEQLDTTRLGLVFADSDEIRHEIVTGSVLNRSFVIPAGAARHLVTASSIRSPRASRLLGLMPHMHARGAAFRFEAEFPNGESEILLDVPRYDFNWQTSYRLLKPRALPSGTRLRCVAHFDNSAANPANPDPTLDVHNGFQSQDEMMLGYFDVAVRRDEARERRSQVNQPTIKPAQAP